MPHAEPSFNYSPLRMQQSLRKMTDEKTVMSEVHLTDK